MIFRSDYQGPCPAASPTTASQRLLFGFVVLLPFANPSIDLLGYRAIAPDFLFIALVITFAAELVTRRRHFVWDNSYWFLLLYLAALTASLIASKAPMTSAAKLLTQFYLIALPVIAVNLIQDDGALRKVLNCWLAATGTVALVAVVALIMFFAAPESPILDYARFHPGTLPPGDYPRLQITFANANMACNYLSVSLAILLAAYWKRWTPRWLFFPLLTGVAIAAASTISAGLGALPLVVGVWLWLTRDAPRDRLGLIALFGGIAVALLFLIPIALTPYLHRTAPFLINLSLLDITVAPSGRLMLWMDAVRNFSANPIIGRGIGIPPVSVTYISPSGVLQKLTDSHNSFLNVAVQAGSLGLAALLILTLHAFHRAGPAKMATNGSNAARLGLGTAFLAAFVYQGISGSFEDARHLWLLFGLIVSADRVLNNVGPSGR